MTQDELHEANLKVLEACMAHEFMLARRLSTPEDEAWRRMELQARIQRHLRKLAPTASVKRLEAAAVELSWAAVELRVGFTERFFRIAEREGCAGCCKWN